MIDRNRTSSSHTLPQTSNQLAAGEEDARHREESLDQTLADSFPNSDPPSTIPNPSGVD